MVSGLTAHLRIFCPLLFFAVLVFSSAVTLTRFCGSQFLRQCLAHYFQTFTLKIKFPL